VAAGLTQRDLAQAAGIAQNTIHKLERCSRGAYLTTMRKLCEALRVDAVDLLIASPEEHEDELKGTQDEKIRQNGQ
jgi:transcriptional regulator with XRE-family HTH domain